jgi:hypothetical protein
MLLTTLSNAMLDGLASSRPVEEDLLFAGQQQQARA